MSTRSDLALCLIEDDPIMGESLVDRLELEGLRCEWHRDGQSALGAFSKGGFAAVISDIRLPDIDGEELYRRLLDGVHAVPPTLFITGYGSVDQAVRLLHLGAQDYITKPFDLDDLLGRLRVICPALFVDESWRQREAVLGVSAAMRHIQDVLALAAAHRARVLLTGESGVGKEHAARYFHDCGGDSRTFHAFNCAAVQETLLEAELFGYEKGAFTGAVRAHRGVFERAHGGTLLLDEVGDMSLAMQAKLLRVLQDGRVERVGNDRAIDVDVRLICATNRDLEQMVAEQAFREDLFYRINVVNVHVPPLRERREDIAWFARMFVDKHRLGGGVKRVISPSAQTYLQQHPWPGNVRELQHAVERACIFAADTVIETRDFDPSHDPAKRGDPSSEIELKAYLERCERGHIRQALEDHDWRVAETASALGISRKNLWEKMRRHAIRRAGELES
jgi:DNA-binding NtrC family response regulator